MEQFRLGAIDDRGTRLPRSKAKIHVVERYRETLVHTAKLAVQRRAYQHAGRRHGRNAAREATDPVRSRIVARPEPTRMFAQIGQTHDDAFMLHHAIAI